MQPIVPTIFPLPKFEIVPKKLGIENIKEAFTFLLDVTNKGIELSKNFSWPMAMQLAFSLASAQGLKPVFKKSLAEFKDLDAKESKEVTDHIKKHFDISNDELEMMIEEAIELLPEVYATLLQNIKTYNKVQGFVQKLKSKKIS